jgi:ubiquinone/menaquinone biosynthesis C-methylase UbiE
MAGQLSELERLQLQARVWEPAGERLLGELGDGTGRRALDVGCGCYGWLQILSRWVGEPGSVTGTDLAPEMLDPARELVAEVGLRNVSVIEDDLFNSVLAPGTFDLVHARFQLAPLGRMSEQVEAYRRLLAPGGILVLEDPDTGSWGYSPDAPGLSQLIDTVLQAFRVGGGDFDAGRQEYDLLAAAGLDPSIRAEVVALPPGHPYQRLPIQFATSLRPRLLDLMNESDLNTLLTRCEEELSDPARRGLSFTLVQTWATNR